MWNTVRWFLSTAFLLWWLLSSIWIETMLPVINNAHSLRTRDLLSHVSPAKQILNDLAGAKVLH